MGMHAGSVIDVVNRNLLVNSALQAGYSAYLPVSDARIDLILHREGDGRLFKVQLKNCWTVRRRDLGGDIWIAFPAAGEWYLAPHDEMVARAPEEVRDSPDWAAGNDTMQVPSREMLEDLADFRLAAVLAPLEASSSETARAKREALADRLSRHRRTFRSGMPPLGVEGILQLRDEGRRF